MWAEKREDLTTAVEQKLWSADAKAYLDYDFIGKKFTGVLTPASFMPLYSGFASKDNAKYMARHAADKNGFYPGMPTIAYGDPRFSDNYMRGPCWLHVAAFALQGLRRYGYIKTAEEIRQTILRWTYNGGYPFEYYDAKTGYPGKGAAARFSWSAAFIIELLLDWQQQMHRFDILSFTKMSLLL